MEALRWQLRENECVFTVCSVLGAAFRAFTVSLCIYIYIYLYLSVFFFSLSLSLSLFLNSSLSLLSTSPSPKNTPSSCCSVQRTIFLLFPPLLVAFKLSPGSMIAFHF